MQGMQVAAEPPFRTSLCYRVHHDTEWQSRGGVSRCWSSVGCCWGGGIGRCWRMVDWGRRWCGVGVIGWGVVWGWSCSHSGNYAKKGLECFY